MLLIEQCASAVVIALCALAYDRVGGKGRIMRLAASLRALSFAAAVCVSVQFFVSSASAQVDTGTILGTVRDPSGGVMPGVEVTLTNENQHASQKTTSNSEGNYQFAAVRVGSYSISARIQGFGMVTQQQ